MMYIRKIKAYQILDSRGFPTVEVEIFTDELSVRASVPSGKSTGSKEAVEIRDHNSKIYCGKSVLKAIKNVNEIIAPALIESDLSCVDQRGIDAFLKKLDNTRNKSRLGSNAILPVSIAFAKLGAELTSQSLYNYLGGCNAHKMPIPMLNVINGGVHADNNIDFQEFMIVPIGFSSFAEAIRAGSEIYQTLRKILTSSGHKILVGDEGGFAPQVNSINNVFEMLVQAIKDAGYLPSISGERHSVAIAIDAAANELFVNEGPQNSKYYFKKLASYCKSSIPNEKFYCSSEDLVSKYVKWTKLFPIISIEDPFHEDDWRGFELLTAAVGKKIQIVGDDIFVTNKTYLKKGIYQKTANSVLVKLNQIGTLTETIDLINYAHKHNFTTVISHRSGETTESFIADLAVGFNTGFIKSGAPCRSERLAKYNRLLRIEQSLNLSSCYEGIRAFYNLDFDLK